MVELPKQYNIKESESRWLKYWEEHDIFKFDNKSDKETFAVDNPPPTVSGKMHLGHSFSYAQQDINVRVRRMLGYNVYYPFGTDDNGLPTEKLVEKLKKVRSVAMERSEFVKLCNETLKEIKDDFVLDWKKIGMSCDFKNASYSTIDPYCIKTSQASFVDLFNKKLVYQDEAPSMWCVNCQTAIAQAELEDADLSSTFNDVEFSIVDLDEKIIIATTRPELLPACVCIFVNPNDKRYLHLIGKKAKVPLFEQEVTIFADESAQMDKGSGILMICSYGDRFDVDAIKRHKLKARVCIARDGKLNDVAKEFNGLKIKEARLKILEKLESTGFLKNKKQITHTVNVHDKCGFEIEFLTTKQWFVKVCDFKEAIKRYGSKINWYPLSMKTRFDNWVENLNWDWCISRQRHFGVSIPIWYCDKCGALKIASIKQLPV
ncbi:MAG: class I tRNA ligase family protein, partial [Candidatus Woesearchaeota archaeon]